ncbi:hypothetical protein ACFVIY_17930 [Streptomyces sp. NPDC127166]|uniref:hypothetical protein n=1 Tax=Streptomyces sp. NPDC127166 TaxID=3345380 RepID=UPI00363F1E0F
MTDHDDHIQHTWILTHPTGDEITIDLWTDGESVRVEGGQGESTDGGRKDVDRLIEKYCLRGYWVTAGYEVNDPHEPELPDDRPDECAECGQPCEYVPDHYDGYRTGPAWMCTGCCKWGQWSAGI